MIFVVSCTFESSQVYELDLGEWAVTPYNLVVNTCVDAAAPTLDTILWVGVDCPGQDMYFYGNLTTIVDDSNVAVWYQVRRLQLHVPSTNQSPWRVHCPFLEYVSSLLQQQIACVPI